MAPIPDWSEAWDSRLVIARLTAVAHEIAALRTYGERSGNAAVEASAVQMAGYFTRLLDSVAERDGMLAGEMPWWIERRDA